MKITNISQDTHKTIHTILFHLNEVQILAKAHLRRRSIFFYLFIVVQCSVVQNKRCCKFEAVHVRLLQGTVASQPHPHKGEGHFSLAYFATKLYLGATFLPQDSFNLQRAFGDTTL